MVLGWDRYVRKSIIGFPVLRLVGPVTVATRLLGYIDVIILSNSTVERE